jgi:hypothetical protein
VATLPAPTSSPEVSPNLSELQAGFVSKVSHELSRQGTRGEGDDPVPNVMGAGLGDTGVRVEHDQ